MTRSLTRNHSIPFAMQPMQHQSQAVKLSVPASMFDSVIHNTTSGKSLHAAVLMCNNLKLYALIHTENEDGARGVALLV